MKRYKAAAGLIILIFGFAFIKNSGQTSDYIKSGLAFFYAVIIPSLFPLTFVTAFIMNLFKEDFNRFKYGNIIMIFLFSQVGGYIIGAKLISDAVNSGTITKDCGRKMSLFCVGGGIGFIYTAVGIKTFNSPVIGVILLAGNILYNTLLFFLFFKKLKIRKCEKTAKTNKPIAEIFCDCVFGTSSVMLKIGGFIVLFSAVNSLIPNRFEFISCFTEITAAVNKPLYLPFAAFLIGFGGLSVIFQVISLLNGIVDIKYFLLSRLIHGLFCFGFTYLAVKIFGIALPVIADCDVCFAPVFDKISVSVSAIISIIMLILSLESKNRGGNPAQDLLQ